MWIHGINCFPDPIPAPTPYLMGNAIFWSAPSFLSSIMPILTIAISLATLLTLNALAAPSQLWQTVLRKSVPFGVSSSYITSDFLVP